MYTIFWKFLVCIYLLQQKNILCRHFITRPEIIKINITELLKLISRILTVYNTQLKIHINKYNF